MHVAMKKAIYILCSDYELYPGKNQESYILLQKDDAICSLSPQAVKLLFTLLYQPLYVFTKDIVCEAVSRGNGELE